LRFSQIFTLSLHDALPIFLNCESCLRCFLSISKTSFSLLSALSSDQHINIIKIANGKAAINIAISKADNPPDHKSTEAIPAKVRPHTTFTFVLGFNVPPVVSIAKTKVPESAEVIKNDEIKITARPMRIEDIGVNSRKPNNAAS